MKFVQNRVEKSWLVVASALLVLAVARAQAMEAGEYIMFFRF
jgi:hypothetical protein